MANPPGTEVDHITIGIDYEIIDHFSRHLYGSPNKAIEELAANGFDAFAERVFVYIPGAQVEDVVIVWDDGDSMSVTDLKRLWLIARSPKQSVPDRIETRGGRTRKLIGKFGIGKLASYSVGDRMAHLCRNGDEFLLVEVDYQELFEHLEPAGEDIDEPRDEIPDPYRTPITRLNEEEARGWAEEQFDTQGDAFKELWSNESWTLALIGKIKPGVKLTTGRLSWVLGNGMPLRPDFKIWVNDTEVVPKLAKGAAVEWTLDEPAVRKAIQKAKKEARDDGELPEGEWQFEDQEQDEWPADGSGSVLRLPNLGPVRAEVRIYEKSLEEGRSADYDRSYGFFVLVRGRLINPNDPQLLLNDPSFGIFYRAQFMVFADGLDEDLLADRERVRSGTPRTRELRVLQRALYRAARAELTSRDAKDERSREASSLLPNTSRELFRDPLTALLVRRGIVFDEGFAFEDPDITRTDLEEGESLASVSHDGSGFNINTAHPLFVAIQKRVGSGSAAKRALQAVDLLAVGDLLLEGHMYDLGFDIETIDGVVEWNEALLRNMAVRYEVAPDELVAEVENTSYKGNEEFERSLARLFREMGFTAHHSGKPGENDVLVVAPTGTTHFAFTVEAKGSRHPIANDDAEISVAAAHRDLVEAQHAVVVAREFVGFERRGDEATVLGECRSVERVSIATVENLTQLYGAMRKYSYPLELILPALTEIETPSAKSERVASLSHPIDDVDYRAILEDFWELQQNQAAQDRVPFRSVWQRSWRDTFPDFDDYKKVLAALDTLSRGLMRLSLDNETVELSLVPELISERIARSLGVETSADFVQEPQDDEGDGSS